MNLFKKTVVALSIISFFCLYSPRICLCRQNRIYAKAETSASITKHSPEFIAPPEQRIPQRIPIIPADTEKPVETIEKPEKWKKWMWVGLGVLAAGVLAGAGGSGGSENPPPTTGDITIKWND